jgi:hypothetical protein
VPVRCIYDPIFMADQKIMGVTCMLFLFLWRSKNYGSSSEFPLHAHKFWKIFSFPQHTRKNLDDMSHTEHKYLYKLS